MFFYLPPKVQNTLSLICFAASMYLGWDLISGQPKANMIKYIIGGLFLCGFFTLRNYATYDDYEDDEEM